MTWQPSTERRTHILNALAGLMPDVGEDTPSQTEVGIAYVQALRTHLSFAGFLNVDILGLQSVLQPIATNLSHTWDGDNYAWEAHVKRAERAIEAAFTRFVRETISPVRPT